MKVCALKELSSMVTQLEELGKDGEEAVKPVDMHVVFPTQHQLIHGMMMTRV